MRGSFGERFEGLRFLGERDVERMVEERLPLLPMSHEQANLFFQIVARRCEMLCYGTHLESHPWQVGRRQPCRPPRLVDRVLHHSAIVSINGESYRPKNKRQAGLLTVPAKATKQ